MEPLAALSLAGNIVQFVEFGGKLLKSTRELYKSSVGGTLPINHELALVTSELRVLITKLRQYFPKTAGNAPDQEVNGGFEKICDEAAKVAEELVRRLDTLKVGGKASKLGSFYYAIRSLWSEKEIAELTARLSVLKESLESKVLFSMLEHTNLESLRNSSRFTKIDSQTQQILTSILELKTNTNRMSQEFRDGMESLTMAMATLLCRLDNADLRAHHRTRQNVWNIICQQNGIPWEKGEPNIHQITAGIEMLGVSEYEEKRVRESVCDEITKSLAYSSMAHRYEDVVEAYPNTFEWAFTGPRKNQRPWGDLPKWLREDAGVYWICGKAGSGKSTFMKYLYDEPRTRRLLEVWAKGSQLCIASFFFWNSGTRDQKSQAGLLRSLLFQIFDQCPELVPLFVPHIWTRFYEKAIQSEPTPRTDGIWTMPALFAAFKSVVQHSVKVCFIIDGLDEFDGDHEAIGILFQEIAKSKRLNVKACLSSRPWIVFEDLFNSSPMLRLQHLTFPDIEQYVKDRFHKSAAYQRLAIREPEAAENLGTQVIEKAEGVFLWVKLVVQSLLVGIRNRDGVTDLRERLHLMPKELEPLYSRLLELVDPVYLSWFSKACQIVRANRNSIKLAHDDPINSHRSLSPLTLENFYLAINEEADSDILNLQGNSKYLTSETRTQIEQMLQERCEDTVVHLTARCVGLLEATSKTDDIQTPRLHVQYFHRTARDFIENRENWSQCLEHTNDPSFSPNTAMMRSCVVSLQLLLPRVKDNTTVVLELLDDLMVYGSHADTHHDSQRAQVKLLKRLKTLLENSQWTPWDKIDRDSPVDLFLQRSAIFGLGNYVRESLSYLKVGKSRDVSNQLLSTLVSMWGFNDLPLPTVHMFQVLIDIGANVNSAWKNMLALHADIDNVREKGGSIERNTTVSVPRQKRHIGIMLLLVSCGANLDIQVKRSRTEGDKRKTYTVIEFVENVLLRDFPHETAPLLNSIRERIRLKARGRKRAWVNLVTSDEEETSDEKTSNEEETSNEEATSDEEAISDEEEIQEEDSGEDESETEGSMEDGAKDDENPEEETQGESSEEESGKEGATEYNTEDEGISKK